MSVSTHGQTAQRALKQAQDEGLVKGKTTKKIGATRKAALQTEILSGQRGVRKLLAKGRSEVARGSYVPGQELKDLQRLLWAYKEWAKDVCPQKASAQLFREMRDISAARMLHAVKGIADDDERDRRIAELRRQELEQSKQTVSAAGAVRPGLRPVPFVQGTAAAPAAPGDSAAPNPDDYASHVAQYNNDDDMPAFDEDYDDYPSDL